MHPGSHSSRSRIARTFAVIIVSLSITPASADTVQVVSNRDNTLIESATGHVSGGLMPFVFAGNTSQGPEQDGRRGLMRFDVSSIPLGSTINSASVRLYMSRSAIAGPNDYSLHRVLADWGEGTTGGDGGQGGLSTPQSATWIHRFYPDVLWTSIGGDFNASPSATLFVAGIGSYTCTSPQLAADVHEWLRARASNFGWLLKGPEGPIVSAKRFESREALIAADRPTLIIDFTPPAVIGACCLDGNMCVQASPIACAAAGGSYGGNGVACDDGSACCAEDINDDGEVNVDDLDAVILGWGACADPCPRCAADIDGNCTVDVDDLIAVILGWGPCPPAISR